MESPGPQTMRGNALYGVAAGGINRRWAAALLAASALASSAGAAEPGKPSITERTARSGGPLDPEQARLAFEALDLAIEVFPEREAIAGIATLTLSARTEVTRVPLDLDRNLAVSAVAIDGRALARTAWSNPDGRLTIALPAAIAPGTRFAVRIAYGGAPHVAKHAPWDGGFVWAKAPDGQPWIASAIQVQGCDLLWPCFDHPSFEPKRAELHFTVPRGLKAPANGVLRSVEAHRDGRTTWHWSARDPTPYGISLTIGPYEEIRADYRSRFGNVIPMHFWHLPGRAEKARGLFAEFAPTLDFFESVIGPYPFADEKVGVVETPHLGMEHQTINAYGNEYKKTIDGFDWLFQHEFAHEWFANQMTVGDWDDFWLHEAFGTYMQPLFGRWREGDARYLAMLAKQREGIADRAPLVSGAPRTAGQTYSIEQGGPGIDIYYKGSWILHTLRWLIGDAAFFDATRSLVYGRTDPRPGNFRPRSSSTREFRAIVDRVSGRDLGWFFDAYLDQAALPDLVQTRSGTTIDFAWKTPADRPFPMPIEVEVDGQRRRLAMANGRESVQAPPGAHVVVDPMARVLRRLPAVEAMRAR